MEIIGLRVEKYVGKKVDGGKLRFSYENEIKERCILQVIEDYNAYEISLWVEEGPCPSGWSPATWGRVKVDKVEKFGGYTHKPKQKIVMHDCTINDFKKIEDTESIGYYDSECIENDVLWVSYHGSDGYYPDGGYEINMNLFEPTKRAKQKRPVWIFVGDSASGKSYLSDKIAEPMTKFETDSVKEDLPKVITEDIVVLGNKHGFAVDDIIPRLFGECEVIIVDFNIMKK